jgi:uncharacterized low-complexity protein
MLNHKLRNTTYIVVVGALLIVSGHAMFAQNQSSSQELASNQKKAAQKKASDEKKAANPEKAANLEASTQEKAGQEKAGEKKAKSSAESCDGALDIVPVKSMSFSRKRHPVRTDSEIPVDAKPNKTPDQKDDVNPNKLRQNEE